MIKVHSNSILFFIKKHQTYFAFAIIGLFAIILLRSAFYGIVTPDESFYLTIPYRLIEGDSLLVDEWHASQFSAFLLYLPMKLYLSITKSTEGIILYFRCLYVFCQTAISGYTFYKLKKYGTIPALVSTLIFLLYVPEEVKMLDYYTMSLMGIQVGALTLFCTEKLKVYHYVFTGIVFACAVTAQPFNCGIYFIYCFAVLFCSLKKKKKGFSEIEEKFLSIKSWLYITIGIVCVAIIFLLFLFSQITISELINNIGNLFGGHDHTLPFSQTTGETDMFSYGVILKTLYGFIPISFVLSVVLCIALYIDKKRIENRKKWIYISLVAFGVFVLEYVISVISNPISLLFRPYILFIITITCLMLTEKKDINLLFLCFTGITYIVFLGVISQALDYVGVIGLAISNCALVPSLSILYNEIKVSPKKLSKKKKQKNTNNINQKLFSTFCIVISFVIFVDMASGLAIKKIDDITASAFGRENTSADTVISKGPLKNIRTDHKTAQEYYDILSDLKKIKENSCEKILVAGLIPFTYFCFDDAPATFTAWYIDEELNLYEDYYKNNEKIPQCIYVPKTQFFWVSDYTDEATSKKDFFSKMFSVDIVNGKAGYIMYVKDSDF